jgi:hypothetical protein
MVFSTPSRARSSAVPSLEPSFTTITGSPSAAIRAKMSPSVPALLNVGATTTGRSLRSAIDPITLKNAPRFALARSQSNTGQS